MSTLSWELTALPWERTALPWERTALPWERTALPLEQTALPGGAVAKAVGAGVAVFQVADLGNAATADTHIRANGLRSGAVQHLGAGNYKVKSHPVLFIRYYFLGGDRRNPGRL